MASVIFWTIIFSLATAFSIPLSGSRDIISGNLFQLKNFLHLIFHWKFILSMFLAVVARGSFILINNALLKIPRLAEGSTTITTFITLFSIILVVIANYIFLKERINLNQGVGAFLIMIGVWVILK